MRKKNFDPGRNFSLSLSLILFVGGLLAAVLALGWVDEAQAQDEGPVCPTGFVWQRMSGVGCVQEDCAEAGGRYTYESNCICNEGMKSCWEPVSYDNFDQESCGIFCPGSRLVACVEQDALCPGEQAPEIFDPTEIPEIFEPSFVEPEPGGGQFESVEHFIVGRHTYPPQPARAAAAAVASTVMLSAWAMLQRLGQRSFSGGGKRGAEPNANALAGGASGNQPGSDPVRQAGGELWDGVMTTVDRWPGGGGDEKTAPPAPTQQIERPVRSQPVTGLVVNPHSEVFYGEDALVILQELEKLPWTIQRTDPVRLGDAGLRGLAGPHPDGRPRWITLPAGRQVIVARVLSMAYADASNPTIVEISEKLALTAELVEEAGDDFLEAPTMRRIPPEDSDDIFDAPTIFRGADDPEDDDES